MEARKLRTMVRMKDEQLVMLYRFYLRITEEERMASIVGRTPSSNKPRQSSHDSLDGLIDPPDSAELEHAHHAAFHPTSAHSRHSSAAVPSAINTAAAAAQSNWRLPPAMPTHTPRSKSVNDGSIFLAAPSQQQQSSKYTTPRTPTGNFAHKHRISSAAAVSSSASPPLSSSKSAAAHQDHWYESDSSQEEEPEEGNMTETTTMQQQQQREAEDNNCSKHVARNHARFVFTVREMLADIAAEAAAAR